MDNIRDNVKSLRRDFDFGTLSENDISTNPMEVLKYWLQDAINKNIKDANAFVLSTAINNQPDSRVVLARDISEDGLKFYTNYSSKKGQDLEENTLAAVNFFWADLDRQVRVKVQVKKLAENISDAYFASRPRGSQIGAWASEQSETLENREKLEKKVIQLEEKFDGMDVPRPDFWGGYSLIPTYFEFWQGRKSRLHDRIIFEKEENGWKVKRLYP